ncbi:MAG: ATPase [Hyphomicrobiales bacterium]|nr:ATPase [Hyphomicrobiales bacterium]
MRDDLFKALLPTHGEPIDPVEMARRDLRKTLPKRFYSQATIEERDGAFVLLLDGRPARTPARNLVALPTQAAGLALAAEWDAQIDIIDPAKMPITRIVNSALDGVSREVEAVRAEVVRFAGSDLVCYRATDPEGLVQAQAALWDPVLEFARHDLGARLLLAQGIIHVEQPDHALAAVSRAVEAIPAPIPLACVHVVTTLTGSALLALAVARGQMSVEAAWAATHADEDFQMRIWGADADALTRREIRWAEMQAACGLYTAIQAG